MKRLALLLLVTLLFGACENRDINEGEEFRPRSLQDSFVDSHFSRVTVDGVEYLMLERDNNNPHEGFGFMAFRANVMLEKQDTLLAYVRAISDIQVKILSEIRNEPIEDTQSEFDEIFSRHLLEEALELEILEMDSLDAR